MSSSSHSVIILINIIVVINQTYWIFGDQENCNTCQKMLKSFLFHDYRKCCILCCLTPIRPHEDNQWIVYLAAPQAQSPPPSYNAIDLSFNGYNWTYNYSNDTSQDMTPCQGNCMDPCTQQCSMSQDCCCCDPNLMAQTQMAAAPLPATPAAPVAPAYQQASQATLKLQANSHWNTCGRCCGN